MSDECEEVRRSAGVSHASRSTNCCSPDLFPRYSIEIFVGTRNQVKIASYLVRIGDPRWFWFAAKNQSAKPWIQAGNL